MDDGYTHQQYIDDMTFEQFVVEAEGQARNMPCYRRGQAYFNLLVHVRPDLAEQVRGSLCDPFYQDKKIGAFMEFIGARWDAM